MCFLDHSSDILISPDRLQYPLNLFADSFNLLVNNGAAAGQVIFHVS